MSERCAPPQRGRRRSCHVTEDTRQLGDATARRSRRVVARRAVATASLLPGWLRPPAPSSEPALLPAWEVLAGGGRGRQLAWDGRRVRLVDAATFAATTPDGRHDGLAPLSGEALLRGAARCVRSLSDAFVPDARAVTPDYWPYARWRFVQRVAAQAISVLGTQQMLRALGLGAHRSLPAAAALDWVLKDGLGRVGKLAVATRFGNTFDSDVKRARFVSSVLYDAAAMVEMLTPLAPRHFLLLATLANVGKSCGVTTALAVRGPMQKSFALEENLADVGARTSAQQVLADSAGLALAVGLGWAMRGWAHPAAPLLLFPPLAAVDLAAIHAQLKSVQLKTLNRERCEIAAGEFVGTRRAPDPARVAREERLVIPARLDASSLPARITSLCSAARSRDGVLDLLAQPSAAREGYVLAYDPAPPEHPAWRALCEWASRSHARPVRMRGRLAIALSSTAGSADVLQALLQVAHLRRLPFRPDLGPGEARAWAVGESLRRARADRSAFLAALVDAKWQTEHFLLSSQERAPFTLAKS